MRKGELLGLRKSVVDLETGTITIRRSYDSDTTKGGRAQLVDDETLGVDKAVDTVEQRLRLEVVGGRNRGNDLGRQADVEVLVLGPDRGGSIVEETVLEGSGRVPAVHDDRHLVHVRYDAIHDVHTFGSEPRRINRRPRDVRAGMLEALPRPGRPDRSQRRPPSG